MTKFQEHFHASVDMHVVVALLRSQCQENIVKDSWYTHHEEEEHACA